ncbi:uncharacterized protein G6M90_00g105240 [Metarhizium brunneum]|uniref:Hydroxynaphthalene reductase-like protein Arp2 n=1 Tax=Metarhizium brunneum TaxID=500148 RepID=A0A7D5Z9N5_9HYPO
MVDILVYNATARNEKGTIFDISEEQWASTFRVNTDSYSYLTKAILPFMAKNGCISNSASVDSYIGVPSRLDYATTKAPIIAFTRSLSNYLIKKGLRVNAVAAGPVWTPSVASGMEKPRQQGHGLGNWTPMD